MQIYGKNAKSVQGWCKKGAREVQGRSEGNVKIVR